MIALAKPSQLNSIDEVIHGEALAVLRTLPDNSVDAIVCDPPAGISFMNKTFDSDRGGRDFWIAWLRKIMAEALRVLKPGGHAFVWALPRTSHWTGMALEDAGFEIRDVVTHLFGSGFPKSADISKQIDKMNGNAFAWRKFSEAYAQTVASSPYTHSDIDRHLGIKSSSCYWARLDNRGGMPPRHHWEKVQQLLNLPSEFEQLYDEAEREVIGQKDRNGKPPQFMWGETDGQHWDITAPATPEASQWDGWGTALKPASEHWYLVRKPLSEKSIAENVLKWGTGAINIDATRIGTDEVKSANVMRNGGIWNSEGQYSNRHNGSGTSNTQGRWPANLLLSHSVWCVPNVDDWLCDESCPVRLLDEQSGVRASSYRANPNSRGGHAVSGSVRVKNSKIVQGAVHGHDDKGGASRYFQRFAYIPKASRAERNRGCEGLPYKTPGECTDRKDGSAGLNNPRAGAGRTAGGFNTHPTVKSIALMRYLVRMITPPGGIVLDCFAGSGSTLVAAIHEGMHFIGIEMNDSEQEPYVTIARARIEQTFQEVQS